MLPKCSPFTSLFMLNSDRDRTVIKGGGRAREMSYREAKKRTDVGGRSKVKFVPGEREGKERKLRVTRKKTLKTIQKNTSSPWFFVNFHLKKYF